MKKVIKSTKHNKTLTILYWVDVVTVPFFIYQIYFSHDKGLGVQAIFWGLLPLFIVNLIILRAQSSK